jgi:hypothetical protein
MKTMQSVLVMFVAAVLLVPCAGHTQEAPAAAPQQMSFFVTSVGSGRGGDLGGLAGADAHCQALAKAAGSNKTWRAYLSTQGPNAVNARDRIGTGPWRNIKGTVVARDNGHLHGDTLEIARLGNNINSLTTFTEKGEKPSMHDILTGTRPDGTAFPEDGMDHTCRNWTSSTTGSAQLGHYDRVAVNTTISWVTAHPSRGCSMEGLADSGGAGLFYCFATD